MVFSRWAFYVKRNITVEDVSGVYELSNSRSDESEITYIGRGKLRTELLRYEIGDSCKSPSMYFRYEKTESDEGAQQREKALLQEFENKYGRLPKCNHRIG